jgi:Domain of unknown function (DUF4124)
MKPTHKLVLVVATLGLGAGAAYASDIYKFTDANGTVHYVDRPTGSPTEQRLAISSKPTNPADVQARAQVRYGQAAGDEQSQDGEESEKAKLTRAERVAAAQERADKCQQYRDRLETYVTSRRLYRETDKGEREYLDEQEVLDARRKTEDLVREYCD